MTNPHRPNDTKLPTKNTKNEKQVLISIQSLIFVSEPYFNEPGFEGQLGTAQVRITIVLACLCRIVLFCCCLLGAERLAAPPRTASCNVSECPLSSFTFPCFCLVVQGRAASSSYNSKIRNGTLILGIVEALEKSPGAMGDVKKTHFRLMKVYMVSYFVFTGTIHNSSPPFYSSFAFEEFSVRYFALSLTALVFISFTLVRCLV